jgi:hypothetical protein
LGEGGAGANKKIRNGKKKRIENIMSLKLKRKERKKPHRARPLTFGARVFPYIRAV